MRIAHRERKEGDGEGDAVADQPIRELSEGAERALDVAVKLMSRANTWIFQKSGGRFGARFLRGAPVLLLTTTGARSGARRTTPLIYVEDAGRLVLVASKGGWPPPPATSPSAAVLASTGAWNVWRASSAELAAGSRVACSGTAAGDEDCRSRQPTLSTRRSPSPSPADTSTLLRRMANILLSDLQTRAGVYSRAGAIPTWVRTLCSGGPGQA